MCACSTEKLAKNWQKLAKNWHFLNLAHIAHIAHIKKTLILKKKKVDKIL